MRHVLFCLPLLLLAVACAEPAAVALNPNTYTSVPTSTVGAAGSATQPAQSSPPAISQATNSGLVLALASNNNMCLGVDTVAEGGTAILRACDGNAATLWFLVRGRLRMNNTLCLGVQGADAAATSLGAGQQFGLFTCDETTTSQRIEVHPNGGIGPTLGSNTYAISAPTAAGLGSKLYPVPTGQAGASLWVIAGTTSAQPGAAGKFALRFADDSNACVALGSSGHVSVQLCGQASNMWAMGPNNQLTDRLGHCLDLNVQTGELTLPTCTAPLPASQQWGTFGGQLYNGGQGMCITFAPPIFGATSAFVANCAQNMGRTFGLGPVVP